MTLVKRLVLDILKPHQPNALEFAQSLAREGQDYRICVTVIEVDEKTESLQLTIEGQSIDFDTLAAAIASLGGSLHSIDEVEVHSEPPAD